MDKIFSDILNVLDDDDDDEDDANDEERRPLEPSQSPDKNEAADSSSFILGKNWRDLIPVIKIDLVSD